MPIWPTSSRVPRGQQRHASFYRVEFGIPALTDRDTEKVIPYPKGKFRESWIFTHHILTTYRDKNSKYLWTMLVLLPGKVLRGAMHRDACANLTAIKALRGSPEGQDQGLLYIEKRPLDTWYLRLLAVRPMGRKQKQCPPGRPLRWLGPWHSRANMR